MLGHGRDDLVNILGHGLVTEVVEVAIPVSERLSHGQGALVMGVEHLFVFFTCEETEVTGVVENLVLV